MYGLGFFRLVDIQAEQERRDDQKDASYDARTHWSEMLQDVKKGERYVILHRGKPIEELMPPQAECKQERSKRAA